MLALATAVTIHNTADKEWLYSEIRTCCNSVDVDCLYFSAMVCTCGSTLPILQVNFASAVSVQIFVCTREVGGVIVYQPVHGRSIMSHSCIITLSSLGEENCANTHTITWRRVSGSKALLVTKCKKDSTAFVRRRSRCAPFSGIMLMLQGATYLWILGWHDAAHHWIPMNQQSIVSGWLHQWTIHQMA